MEWARKIFGSAPNEPWRAIVQPVQSHLGANDFRPENIDAPQTALIACDECDLVQRSIPLPAGGWALCRRCEGPLYRYSSGSLDRSLAFALGALVLFLIANAFPIVELEAQGNRGSANLYGIAQQLWSQDMKLLAALVAATTIVLPAMQLGIMIYMLLPYRLGYAPAGVPVLLRLLQMARPWSMVEVFLLGVLISLIKLAHMASVVTGIALWSLGGLMLLLTAATATFNHHEAWERVSHQ